MTPVIRRIAVLIAVTALAAAPTPAAAEAEVIELPTRVKQADDGLPSRFEARPDAMDGVVWFGGNAVLLSHDRIIYIDPYKIPRHYNDADLVLITHPHYDSCSPRDVDRIAKRDTLILTVAECAERLERPDRTIVVEPGRTYEKKGIHIETVPAYNVESKHHPKDRGWLGFVVESRGVRYYHAGDTDRTDALAAVRADVAFLPIDGEFTMNVYEAAEAARALGVRHAVPIHWGRRGHGAKRAATFRARVGEPGKVLKVGF